MVNEGLYGVIGVCTSSDFGEAGRFGVVPVTEVPM